MEARNPQKEAFLLIVDNLPQSTREVYNAVQRVQPTTYKEIIEYLQKPTNIITSRLNELYNAGLVKVRGYTDTRPRLSIFIITPADEVKDLQNQLLQDYENDLQELTHALKEYQSDLVQKLINDKIKTLKKRISRIKKTLI